MNFKMNALIFKNQFEARVNPFKHHTVELDTGELSCTTEGWRQ